MGDEAVRTSNGGFEGRMGKGNAAVPNLFRLADR